MLNDVYAFESELLKAYLTPEERVRLIQEKRFLKGRIGYIWKKDRQPRWLEQQGERVQAKRRPRPLYDTNELRVILVLQPAAWWNYMNDWWYLCNIGLHYKYGYVIFKSFFPNL